MRSTILGAGLATGFAIALAMPAFAQTNTANQNSSPATTGSISSQSQNTQNASTIREQVQQNLSKAGFTAIKVMPESFLVRAKDPTGNPVMMVINPDSVTAVTYGTNNSSNNNTTNSNATPNANSATSNTNRSNR